MIVEARYGKLNDEDDDTTNKSFPLFGYQPVTEDIANLDNVGFWAARVGVFNQRIQSSNLHFQLKRDLVEHINSTVY